MTHPPYLREKARQLRIEKKLSQDEIADRLALTKTTVWYWIEDLPDPEIKFRDSEGRQRGRAIAARLNRERAKAARDLAYAQGLREFDALDAEPGFRDFICMYIGEGYKRNRNRVSLANSDPRVVLLADFWISRFAANKVTYSLQYHADQDPDELISFWSGWLGAEPHSFVYQRKSNSGNLKGRTWRCRFGVLSVGTNDTQFRARLQAWIDRVQEGWLDSANPIPGV
jgi:transcriptional regulator with XRE-family HTH domain